MPRIILEIQFNDFLDGIILLFVLFFIQVAAFEQDPLIYHGPQRFSWAKAISLSIMLQVECLHKIHLPTLLYHGTEDGIVPFSSSEHIYGAISSTDKTLEVNSLGVVVIF